MRTWFLCAALAAVLQPAGAGAQTVALTESEVLSQLGSGNPRVEAARAVVDLARADVLAAARWPNPRVTFNREAVAGIAEDMLMVSQLLPISGRRRLDVSAAAARVDASASRAEDQIRRVRADLRLAFTDLWAAQERDLELRRIRDRLDVLIGFLGRREAAGDAAGFDRLRAEREVVDLDTTRAIATAERAQAQAMLGAFLASPPAAAVIEAVAPSPANRALPTVDELMTRAETVRGQLTALTRDVEAAGLAEHAAARRAIPEPEVVAGTKTSNAAGGDVGSIVSVHVTVPLFDRARPERAAAQARGRQARAEAAMLRQTIRAQVEAWRAAVIELRANAGRHRASLASGAEQIERIAQISYDAGERGIVELLDAYRIASSARLRQVDLDASVRQAEIELEFVSGWEIP
jgi:cobalt-zinc-cadmium efflux system outer membrane protein